MDLPLQHLRQNGHKITVPRREILNALSITPLSVRRIHEFLTIRRLRIDLATVYRTLELFLKLGLVTKTQFTDRASRFELAAGTDHHHHLICDHCKTVRDITFNESGILRMAEATSKFKIRSHTLEFYGLCPACQS